MFWSICILSQVCDFVHIFLRAQSCTIQIFRHIYMLVMYVIQQIYSKNSLALYNVFGSFLHMSFSKDYNLSSNLCFTKFWFICILVMGVLCKYSIKILLKLHFALHKFFGSIYILDMCNIP